LFLFQSAAVNVICELARKNPKNYLSLAPTFFKLMTSSTNNWMLIKIIKLFGALTPLEPRYYWYLSVTENCAGSVKTLFN
jgi:AP-3 complex subunit delta-1